MNSATPKPRSTQAGGDAAALAKPIGIDVSRREPIAAALKGAADRIREQPWPASGRGKSFGDGSQYDRKRAARQLLEEFAKAASIAKKHQATVLRCGDMLTGQLPESVEDVDGTAVLGWLERELPLQWNDDQLCVPEAEKDAILRLIETTLTRTDRGAVPQDVGQRLAQAIGAHLPPATNKKDAELRQRHVEKLVVGILVASLWRARGRERELAEDVMDGLGRLLRLRWVPLPPAERPYSPTERFAVGDTLVHTKFGRGTVVSGTDTSIEVSFTDGARRLGIARPS